MGRRRETFRLDALISAAGQGEGGALVLRGEPGIGKSALLDHTRRAASGFRVMQASGAEFEMELPFAALHQLCAPVLGHRAGLPAPHRKALEIAFGLDTGTPDPLLVGIATLGLLAETAAEQPLLCVVDDAQWLDHASAKALAFLARRVAAEPVAVVFAVRDPSPEPARSPELDELPALTVEGLPEPDARALLGAELHAPLDEQVRDRILAEARGNPLALLELPRGAGPGGLAGGFALPVTSPPAGRIERSFQDRLERLPAGARLLLSVAAADPVGDPGLLWRAAGSLGIGAEGAEAAAASGLIEFGIRIRFCHPLARSVAYRSAEPEERRLAHQALASATDPAADPDRVAWHHAQAGTGPDEEIAAELDASAARAQSRGGVAATAAFLERAAALSADPARRVDRLLAAAQAKLAVGDFDRTAELLAAATTATAMTGTAMTATATTGTAMTGTARQLAQADLLRGRLSFVRHRGADAIACLLGAARRLTQVDPAWSRACYLDAIEMGILTGGLDAVVREAAAAPAAGPAGSVALLEALVSLVTDGPREAVPALRPLVSDTGHEEWTRRPSLASLLAVEVWDFDAYLGIGHRIVELGRRSGSFFTLPIGLAMAATANVHAGDFGAAVEMISEGAAIAEATGASPLFYPRIHLAALRGRRREAVELFDAVLAAGPLMSISVHWGTAVLNNGLADYPAAFAAARQAVASGDLATAGLALPELIEAALRCGEHEPAASALRALTERTRAGGAWGLGVQAYTRALVTGDEPSFQEAIDRLDGTRAVVYQARAHLLYGEWLRRQGRRREARERLRHAHCLFSDIGMEAFAARAAGELRATGERARNRAHPAGDRLTMQEVHIARLVAGGATSKEVAARLFLSPRTVDAHLRNIFRKLDITSRRQLRDIDL